MKETNLLRIFSARACSAPIMEAASIFEEKTGIKVEISVCSRHCATADAEEASAGSTDDFLLEIADAGIHDLAVSGAEYLLDDGEIRGIVKKGKRVTVAFRESAIIVPSGNPAGISSVFDLTRPGCRIGVSVIDCLKGLWEDVTARIGILEEVRKNITFKASGCIAIVEAVAEKKVDAAIGWSAFKHLAEGRIDVVRMPPEHVVMRGTGIGLLSFSKNEVAAEKFMEFIVTGAAMDCFRKFGWNIPVKATKF